MASKHARDLKAVKEVRAEKAQRIQDLWDLEDKEDRQLEQVERDEIHDLTKALKELEKQQEEIEANLELEKQVKEASKQVKVDNEEDSPSAYPDFSVRPPSRQFDQMPKGLGDQFVESKAYQEFFSDGKAPQGEWQMPTVNLESKATLSSGGTLSGYGPYEQNIPGVIPIADQPLVVGDLMPSNTASGPQVRYFKERLATNAAAGVAETGVKPESVFDFEAKTQSLAKIATFVPVADEMLEDAPAIQAYLNSRLSMFIRTEEERELLHGGGAAANEVEGFLDNYSANGIGSATVSGAPGTLSFGELAVALNETRGSSYLDLDAIIMHPTKFGSILSAYDENGQYYAGGPLSPGLYGAGNNVPLQASRNGGWTLFGIPVYMTSVIGSATSTQKLLVGNFRQGAAVWRRGGISVQASNSHSDFFRRNQTMIRAEERVALTVYRPEAFTIISWT